MTEKDFKGNPEIELIYNSISYFDNQKIYYETACFHRSIDILIVDSDGTITAIEAKISDWKKALHQANTYKLIADFAYILMPDKKIKPEFLELLDKYGIGLMLLGDKELYKKKEAQRSDLIWAPARKRLEERINNNKLDTITPWDRMIGAQ